MRLNCSATDKPSAGMQIGLKPCPFCGSDKLGILSEDPEEPIIYCASCDSIYANANAQVIGIAALIDGWNRRMKQ